MTMNVGLNMRDPPGCGVRIEEGTVSYRKIGEMEQRVLTLQFDPLRGLNEFDVERLSCGQQDAAWVQEQQVQMRLHRRYHVASDMHPLSGFAAGMLPLYNGKVLCRAIEEKDGFVITPLLGSTRTYHELKHPVQRAVKEFASDVSFVNGGTLFLPSYRDSRIVDATISDETLDIKSETVIKEKLDAYTASGIADRTEPGNLQVRFKRDGPLESRLGLDRIVFDNSKQHSQTAHQGWFYWDPTVARVNILFYTHVTTSGALVADRTASSNDASSGIVELSPETFFALGALHEVTARVYAANESSVKRLPLVPNVMTAAITERLALNVKK